MGKNKLAQKFIDRYNLESEMESYLSYGWKVNEQELCQNLLDCLQYQWMTANDSDDQNYYIDLHDRFNNILTNNERAI